MASPGAFLRKKIPGTYFFLTGIINFITRIRSPYSIYITDSLGGSFKEYCLISDMPLKISELKKNLDKESTDTIDVILLRLLNYPDERYKHRISKHNDIVGGLLPNEMKQARDDINKKLGPEKKRYPFLSKHIEESVFYYYHGLSLLPDACAPVYTGSGVYRCRSLHR